MQTIYRSVEIPAARTREGGKVIDLAQYRRRLEEDRRPAPEGEELPAQRTSPSGTSRARWGLFWDAVASLGVLVMTLTFCVQLLA